MKSLVLKAIVAVVLCAPAAAYAQTPDQPATVSPAPSASTPPVSTPPYTVGESPDRPVNIPPPGVTPSPVDDGLSEKAARDADRVRCVPGAACETDGTFRNVQ